MSHTSDKPKEKRTLKKGERRVEPAHNPNDPAIELARKKLLEAYEEEPSATAELTEITHAHQPPSKHQAYLQELQASGASVVEVQTKWHEYYNKLPEAEKKTVWQEFYTEQAKHAHQAKQRVQRKNGVVVSKHDIATSSASRKRLRDARGTRQIKRALSDKIEQSAVVQDKRHPLRSVIFGLGIGTVALLIMLFGLFNELVIAPFIQPSRNVSATPIILDTDGIAADGTSKVIIPKINVEIPVDYSLTSMEEDVIQKGLENGVVHYPTTSRPGEQGNAAFFGHSSNNIFNPGKYKFAFVMLSNLENGDMFYLTYEGKVYAYKVYEKRVVSPNEVSVLNPVPGKTATAALITCDPPGTTINRLVVWGEQISPDPINNASTSGQTVEPTDSELPGQPKTLWGRFTEWLF